jgi:HSP20 family protein
VYRTLFPRDLFAELDRLQRDMQGAFEYSPSIRGLGRGGYPAHNLRGSPTEVEIHAFAPGVDPASIDITLDRCVLSITGERKAGVPASDEKITLHGNERFSGRFRRVVSLPDDIDPNAVSATFTDGVLRVNVKRRESAQPRRIAVQ